MENFEMSDPGHAGGKGPDKTLTTNERSWGLAVHLSALAFHVLPFGGNIIGPLAVWLWKRETSAFVDDQGREAVNAQLSYTIYGLITLIFWFVIIGIPMTIALYIFVLVVTIMGAIAANNGERFRYPFIIRFLKK